MPTICLEIAKSDHDPDIQAAAIHTLPKPAAKNNSGRSTSPPIEGNEGRDCPLQVMDGDAAHLLDIARTKMTRRFARTPFIPSLKSAVRRNSGHFTSRRARRTWKERSFIRC